MTVSRFTVSALIVLWCLLAGAQAKAQYRNEMMASPPPSVLSPDPSVWWIGPQLGLNINAHKGDFVTDVCQCSFENGSGVGVSAGIEIGHMFSGVFGVALKALYSDLSADYSYVIQRDAILKPTREIVQADFERQNVVKLGYFMINPVLQLHPFTGFYVFAGPAIGVRTVGTRTYTLVMVDERYFFDYEDPESKVVEDDSGEIPEAENVRMDFRAGFGVNIRLGRSFLFSPEVSYNFPLSNISSDNNWKAEAIHLIGVFKFEL
ncbi:MAG: outer membrane beta-barrel protein [Bacteroidetes bacterium]|nr:outer membrane beta-barrel protein [Bacteroidota bacterium]